MDDDPVLASKFSGAGLRLFALYLLLYGTFVGVNAFAPELMAKRPTGGLNVAILSGMALIAAAFLLALVYMAICRKIVERYRSEQGR